MPIINSAGVLCDMGTHCNLGFEFARRARLSAWRSGNGVAARSTKHNSEGRLRRVGSAYRLDQGFGKLLADRATRTGLVTQLGPVSSPTG
jgi:hypothetical protein